jgi:hypothetical protein
VRGRFGIDEPRYQSKITSTSPSNISSAQTNTTGTMARRFLSN